MSFIPPIPDTQDAYRTLEELEVEVVSAHFCKQTALASADGFLAIDYGKLNGEAEELELLLHEIGHFERGAFYTQESGPLQRARAETRAARHVFEKYYPATLLARLIQDGDTEPWQLSERLGLPEQFVREMLYFYTEVRQIYFGTDLPYEAEAEPEASPSAFSLSPREPDPGAEPLHWVTTCTGDGQPIDLLVTDTATQEDIQTAALILQKLRLTRA